MNPFQRREVRIGERLGFLLVPGDPVGARIECAARIFAAEHRKRVGLAAHVDQNLQRRKLCLQQGRCGVEHDRRVDGAALHCRHRRRVEPDADHRHGIGIDAVPGEQILEKEIGR